MGKQVFLSHVEEDADLALGLRSVIEKAGYSCWTYEQDSGGDFLRAVFEAIHACEVILLVLSRRALQSHNIKREVQQGYLANRPFVPVLIDLTYDELASLAPEITFALGTTVCLQASGEAPEDLAGRVVREFERLGLAPRAWQVVEVESRLPPAPLFGREDDLARAVAMLRAHSIAVVGIPGIGKSKVLSALFSHFVAERTFALCYWRRFDDTVARSFSAFAGRFLQDVLGLPSGSLPREPAELAALALRTLREGRCLLALDQFESVLDGATLKPADPGYGILLSGANQGLGESRILVSAWEIPCDVAGVGLPALVLSGLDREAAVHLLEARLTGPLLENHGSSGPSQFLDRVAGHPLVIELLAGTFQHPEAFRQLLADAGIWQSTVRRMSQEVASRVLDRLPEPARPSLEALAVLGRPSTLDTIADVAGSDRDAVFADLAEFRNRGIAHGLGATRHDVPDLIREHVLQRMPPDRRACLEDRAAEHYLRRSPDGGPGHLSDDDRDHLLAASNHLARAGQHDRAAEVLIDRGLADDLFTRGHYQTLERLYRQLLDGGLETRRRGQLLGRLGLVQRDLGWLEEAKQYCQEALEIALAGGSERDIAVASIDLGDVLFYLIDSQGSREHLERAAALMPEVGEPDLESRCTGCLGNAYLGLGRIEEAGRCYERAVAICRTRNDQRGLGIWLGDLGALAAKRGDLPRALEFFERAAVMARGVGDRRHEGWWGGQAGWTLACQGDHGRARERLETALRTCEEICFARGVQDNAGYLMNLHAAEGRTADLERVVDRVRSWAASSGNEGLAAQVALDGVILRLNAQVRRPDAASRGSLLAEVEALARSEKEPGRFFHHVLLEVADLAGRKANAEALRVAEELAGRLLLAHAAVEAYKLRAACRVRLGLLEEAIADYEEACARDPGDIPTGLSRAETLIGLGRFADASRAVESLRRVGLDAHQAAVAQWLTDLAGALDGRPVEGEQDRPSPGAQPDPGSYDLTDMDTFLDRLAATVPADRLASARLLHERFKDRFSR